MASPKKLTHQKTFEDLGEEQVRLQFSHLSDDRGIEARAWLYEIEERRRNDRHRELLSEINRHHWSVIPSFLLLVFSVVIAILALCVAISGTPQSQKFFQRLWQSQNAEELSPPSGRREEQKPPQSSGK